MYQYTALDSEDSSFRLLKLLKGSDQADLECELSPQSLQSVSVPYEALSYTWGSSELVECIKLDGEPFWITDNLHSVLKSLRSCDSDRILWIDAICINQEDKLEQSQQVQQMGQIYEKADKVLFWLGKATPQIIALMETLNQFRNTDSSRHYKPEKFKNWPWEEHSIGIKQLMNREWFTRVWILQEAAKARRADVCCGRHSIPSEIFVLALSFVEQKIPPHCKPVLDIMAESFRSSSWWAQARNLRTLLRKFQASKATDERDKIYALLGMSSEPLDAENITIDYLKPTSEVVQEAVTYLLESTRTSDSDGFTTYFLESTQKDSSDRFTMYDALDLMCSFTTLDVTCLVNAQVLALADPNVPGHEMIEPIQSRGKIPAMRFFNDPAMLLFEDRATESLENQKTCYNQIIELMPDQQSIRVLQRYDKGLHIRSWGGVGHRVKVVAIHDKGHALSKAAMAGCDLVVNRLLHTRLELYGEKESEAKALNDIINQGRVGLLQLMLDAGVDINVPDGKNRFPLTVAVARGGEIVKMLLDAGADINAQGKGGWDALRAAIIQDREDVVKMLLDAGADANALSVGVNGETLQMQPDDPADINAMDEYDLSALQEALNDSRIEILKMQLDAGAGIFGHHEGNGADIAGHNEGNNTALCLAVLHGRGETVKLLLNAGADINDSAFFDAVHVAIDTGSQEIVRILLDEGADVDDRALRYAISCGDKDLVKMLLDACADVDAHGKFTLALEGAVSYESAEKVKMLLDAGAQISVRTLEAAKVCGREKILKMLLDAGADANGPKKEETAA